MKHYAIYLTLTLGCSDKAKKTEVDRARVQALEVSQKQFKKDIKEYLATKEVKLLKDQPEDGSIAIGIDDAAIEKIIEVLTKMNIVSIIDAGYATPIKEKEKTTTKKDISRFMK